MERGTAIKGYCFICGQPFERGIRLLGRGLCASCETTCSEITAGDPEYERLVVRIRDGLVRPTALVHGIDDGVEAVLETEGSEVGCG